MEFELSDEQLAYQDAARQFAAGEFAPLAAQWDENEEFPKAVLAKAGELGFCSL
ncbi:MAG: acyl-CoA dehydrogenase family protein, partial [Gammaproteobacteria bacterium]|nr:acyl-CoA dehydrogenase family protein [Gammaproteobacteria bacterium]